MGVGCQHLTLAIFAPRERPGPILREAGQAPGPVWTDAENSSSQGFDLWNVQLIVSPHNST